MSAFLEKRKLPDGVENFETFVGRLQKFFPFGERALRFDELRRIRINRFRSQGRLQIRNFRFESFDCFGESLVFALFLVTALLFFLGAFFRFLLCRVRPRFRFPDTQLFRFGVIAESADVFVDVADAFETENFRGDVVQKIPVVADRDDRAVVFGEKVCEEVERFHVQVVRRFVEHEYVRRMRKQTGEKQAVAFAAGKRVDGSAGALRRKKEILQVTQNVALLPVENDVFLTVADVFHERFVFAEPCAHLVEIGDLKVRSEPDVSGLRREFAQKNFQKGRFAAAVRAHDAHAVASRNFRRKILNQRFALVGMGNVFGADDEPSGAFRLGDLHFDVSRAVSAVRTFFPHSDERPDAALVSRATRLDSLANPNLLFGETLVEKPVRLFFFGESLIAVSYKFIVRKVPGTDASPVEFQNPCREPPDKGPVMANEKDGAGEPRKDSFEPLDARNVEMVCRFVEKKEVRLPGDFPRKKNAALLPAGKRIVRRIGVDSRFSENVLARGMPLRRVADDDVANGAVDVGGNFLNQACGPHPVLSDDFSGIRFHFPGEDFEQRTFPFAVPPHETDAFVFANVEGNVRQKGRVAKPQGQIFDGYQGHAVKVEKSRTGMSAEENFENLFFFCLVLT